VTAADQQEPREKPTPDRGSWKTLGSAVMTAAEADNRKKHARKAREHELKAGKTFRRTKKHLKKAERHERRVDRLKAQAPKRAVANQRRRTRLNGVEVEWVDGSWQPTERGR
jgi:hypothetical protein